MLNAGYVDAVLPVGGMAIFRRRQLIMDSNFRAQTYRDAANFKVLTVLLLSYQLSEVAKVCLQSLVQISLPYLADQIYRIPT